MDFHSAWNIPRQTAENEWRISQKDNDDTCLSLCLLFMKWLSRYTTTVTTLEGNKLIKVQTPDPATGYLTTTEVNTNCQKTVQDFRLLKINKTGLLDGEIVLAM